MSDGDSLEAYLLSVMRGRRGVAPSLLRGLATVLSPVYTVGLKAFLLPFDLGVRKRTKLPCPVLSVGNLTTGGTGKTPLTQALCRALLAEGKRVALLSRGYKGENEFGCAVVSDGEKVLLNAKQAGDEVYLLAKALPGVPVVVGKDRRVTGKLAWEQFRPDVIVLDDGMQYWWLHRDVEIVLLNACDPFDNGWTFPRGLLREPASHLRRANVIVLTNARQAGAERVALLQDRVRRLAPQTPIFTADLNPTGLRTILGQEERALSWLDGRTVASLCAVGNPESFEATLESLGATLGAKFRFRDHAEITLPDLERAFDEACAAGASALIITEKDAVKMPPLKSPLPMLALQVQMQTNDEAAFLNAILNRIRQDEQN